jgi:hypothetical protein
VRRNAISAVFLVGVFCCGAAAAQEPLTADVIIHKAVERAKQKEPQEVEARYTFVQRMVIEKLDASGAVKEREERLYRAEPIDGASYYRLVERNGRALNEKELKQEKQRERKFRESLARRKREKPPKDDDEDRIKFDEELTQRYAGQLLGQEVVNGRPAYVIAFEPKSANLPERRRLDRVFNHLAGKVWIDTEEFEISRVETRLVEPTKFGWGIIASVQQVEVYVEQQRLNGGDWLPARVQSLVNGRVLFRSVHQRQTSEWRDYQKAAAPQNPASRSTP